jgi:predicted helicase
MENRQNNKGILGINSGNSYLYGTIMWKMRKSLLDTFDKIYILNLHGDKDKKEPDENVFDIKVGVCISIFVKLDKPLKEKEVYYFFTLDNKIMSRKNKYEFLLRNDLTKISWKKIEPTKPTYWFFDFNSKGKTIYNLGWKITDIFKETVSGIVTQKDKVTVHFDKSELRKTLKNLIDLSPEKFKENVWHRRY